MSLKKLSSKNSSSVKSKKISNQSIRSSKTSSGKSNPATDSYGQPPLPPKDRHSRIDCEEPEKEVS
jgi:hypothetical protein